MMSRAVTVALFGIALVIVGVSAFSSQSNDAHCETLCLNNPSGTGSYECPFAVSNALVDLCCTSNNFADDDDENNKFNCVECCYDAPRNYTEKFGFTTDDKYGVVLTMHCNDKIQARRHFGILAQVLLANDEGDDDWFQNRLPENTRHANLETSLVSGLTSEILSNCGDVEASDIVGGSFTGTSRGIFLELADAAAVRSVSECVSNNFIKTNRCLVDEVTPNYPTNAAESSECGSPTYTVPVRFAFKSHNNRVATLSDFSTQKQTLFARLFTENLADKCNIDPCTLKISSGSDAFCSTSTNEIELMVEDALTANTITKCINDYGFYVNTLKFRATSATITDVHVNCEE